MPDMQQTLDHRTFPPFPHSMSDMYKSGRQKKSSRFKLLDTQVGLIFRSALPEDLEWENRAEDVALSLDAIKRCLRNMLTALDRDTPQTKNGPSPHNLSIEEYSTIQEPPWLWFTLPELGFPLLTDEYHRPIHPEIEEYMWRYTSNNQDWEQVDDEDCWGVNYTEPTTQIRGNIENILHIWEKRNPSQNRTRLPNRPQKEKGFRCHMRQEFPKSFKT